MDNGIGGSMPEMKYGEEEDADGVPSDIAKGVSIFSGGVKKYGSREERESAFEKLIVDLMMVTIDGKAVSLPGLSEICAIYLQAENANGGRNE